MSVDLNPLVIALAAMVVAITPSVVGAIVAWSTHQRVQRIEQGTNGRLSSLQDEVAALRAQIAGRRAGDKGGDHEAG